MNPRFVLAIFVVLALAFFGRGPAPAGAATPSGAVRAWGDNGWGQLGTTAAGSSAVPLPVTGLTDVIAVAAGVAHTLALRGDGTVWAWGGNEKGQLGDGTNADSAAPVLVSGLTGVRAIAAGHYHSLAIGADGTAWAWGWNAFGQLGINDNSNRNAPERVLMPANAKVRAVAGGNWHSLALLDDGTAWAWGDNTEGQVGDGTNERRLKPVQVVGLTGVTAVAAGANHNLALVAGGVWAWGDGMYGKLGNGFGDRKMPAPVNDLIGATAIAAGEHHSLALVAGGAVRAWGLNDIGQLGYAPAGGSSDRPVPVDGLGDVTAIAAGHNHTLALKTDRTIRAWGYNGQGQLGDNSSENRTTPVAVRDLAAVAAIAAGGFHSLAIGTPAATLSATELAFGDQPVRTTSAPRTITLANNGSAPLNIRAIAASGDFGQRNDCGSALEAGGRCTIDVTFTPSTAGNRAGTLTLETNAANSPHTVTLRGNGTAPAARLSASSVDFGAQQLGTTGPDRMVTLTNSGTAPLLVASVAIAGVHPADFTISEDRCGGVTIAPGDACRVAVRFAPGAAGDRSASLDFQDNASDSPQRIALRGAGLAPGARLGTTSLDFGEQRTGTTSQARTVTLANGGNAPLAIGGIVAAGDFAQTNDCGRALPAGATCTIFVTFAPTAAGDRVGTLAVTSDAAGSPHTVALRGRGAPPPTYSLALAATPGGSVSLSAPGPYAAGAVVTLTAAPDPGYAFAGWTLDGAPAGGETRLSLTMNANYTVGATFAVVPPPAPGLVPPPPPPPAPSPSPSPSPSATPNPTASPPPGSPSSPTPTPNPPSPTPPVPLPSAPPPPAPAAADCRVWSCWQSRGGILTDSPAAAGFNGRVYVFARGSDDALYVTSSADGATFTAWSTLGGLLTAPPAATGAGGFLYVFARGSDNALYLKRSSDGAAFGEWVNLGGVLTAAPAAASIGGQVAVFARGADNALYEKRSGDGLTFGEWRDHGGILAAAPAAATYRPAGAGETLVVLARGTGDALYAKQLGDAGTASAWVDLGGPLVGAPAAAGVGGTLYTFVRGLDNAVWERHTHP